MPAPYNTKRETGPRKYHIRDIKLAATPLSKAQAARQWLEEANRRKSRFDVSLETITKAMQGLELAYLNEQMK